jgi:rhodanese-related sulfurtransferase
VIWEGAGWWRIPIRARPIFDGFATGTAGIPVLDARMPANPDEVLIDVLSPESFGSEHVPGAVNFCVYETAFIDKVKEAFPDTATVIKVCGYCDDTREAAIAAERLDAAGYHAVTVMPGGLKGWKDGGKDIEGEGVGTASVSGRREVDAEASFINWTGRNLFNFHTGSLKLKDGHVELRDGLLIGGDIRIDMESLACSDLTDSKMNRMLIDHLRSDDFFSVADHPVAAFGIVSAEPIVDSTSGTPTHRISGDLTLRGKTSRISFDALVAAKEDGSFTAQAMPEIDRTVFGSIYGSGKFFARLGQHVVNDFIHLHLKVVTKTG